jgi:septal ring factor EnvC (AmiA/AmiB activator)
MSEELTSKVEAQKAEKAQLDQELKEHAATRESCTQDVAKAKNIREKENSDYKADVADMKSNIAAMKSAVAALEKGAGSFLQSESETKSTVLRLVQTTEAVDDFQKQQLVEFFQSGNAQDYAPQSGQITGMLKAMTDEYEGDLKTAESDEATAATGYKDLNAAKNSEIAAATSAIESKTKRSGELAVEIVQNENAAEDAAEEAAETEAFLGNLGAQCAEKKAEWSERTKMRAQEVAAISEAIKILNDDDSLDLFKKTASLAQESSGYRFLQRSMKTSNSLRAANILKHLAKTSRHHQSHYSLIAYAMGSKGVDFSEMTAMIDGMVADLVKEQESDDSQKESCESELFKAAQDKKDTEDELASLAASIEEMSATVATIGEEVDALQSEIKSLDKAVSEATATRKEEHETFLRTQSENSAAVQIVEKAKNRLAKFYTPNLYKAPPKQELTMEEKIYQSSGRGEFVATEAPDTIPGTSIPVLAQIRLASKKAAPPPPPETFGAYQKKGSKSNGVMALMDQMVDELKTDGSEAKHGEEMAQKDYEHLMESSQKSREQSGKSITEKEAAKADWGEKIATANTDQATSKDALQALKELIASLHGKCDFLLETYEMRKDARHKESEGLKSAKGVLNGANLEQ